MEAPESRDSCDNRIDLEEGGSSKSPLAVTSITESSKWGTRLDALEVAFEGLINQSQNNNIKIRGIPETRDEGPVQNMVLEIFRPLLRDIPEPRWEIDRVHSSAGAPRRNDERPRDIIVRFHYHSTKDATVHTCNVLKVINRFLKYLGRWEWGTTHNYLYDPSKSDDIFKSQYTHLIDAGLEINTAYPLILRPERKVDLILSFDFSEGDPFQTLTDAEKYCLKNNIRFPKINIEEEEKNTPSQNCYIFGNDENDVPVVMHFPLFNKMNCKG
ncbi:cytosolic phospholipase A2 gamma isoform X3 [Pelobates cultripes]|uniref:Cytosolic phospholipase A2 gamma isoform X3 n=1 Tax=Pelobates cultripes TaxID=61616 RepID=A0AAD1W5Q4_PELCU|nr:cytosolic phospholipase A2 gamma isoform X3 [Pelobates cultripes]